MISIHQVIITDEKVFVTVSDREIDSKKKLLIG